MLRKMETSQSLDCEEDQGELDDKDVSRDVEEGNFLMPEGSDVSSNDGDLQDRTAEVDSSVLAGRPRPAPLTKGEQSNSIGRSKSAGDVAQTAPPASCAPVDIPESAADYVERVKRSMGLPAAQVAVSESVPRSREAPARARSSDSRAQAPKAAESSSVRAQSNDSRPRISSANDRSRPCEKSNVVGDDDDSDDEEAPPAQSAPWKLDVRSMVKEFAREERARDIVPSKPSSKPHVVRPHKAPANGSRRVADAEPEKSPQPEKSAAPAHDPIAPGEQLFFSRKPRETEFVPATMDEYKQKGYANKEYAEIKPTLGPDLDDDDLLQKKAMQERKKEFSKELQRVNRQRMEAASKHVPKSESKPDTKPTARAKAQEFARNVPKPKPPAAKPPPPERKAKPVDSSKEADLADWEEIKRREKEHLADVIRVKDIKDFLEQLPL
jgi:hypothetical protein